MDYTFKAVLEKNKLRRGFATIVFLGCVGCAALVLAIYSLACGDFLFALAYLVALAFSAFYTVMKINTIIPTYIACDAEEIFFRIWENDFFPYKTDRGFIGEFIPEKVKNVEIPMADIKSIYIGSGHFISRNLPESNFAEVFKDLKKRFSSALRRAEFFHILQKDGTEYYMPVTDFTPEDLANIVKTAIEADPMLDFSTANRKVRRFVPKRESKF